MPNSSLTLNKAFELIMQEMPVFQRKFNVKRLAIFGSLARGELKENSDVDILVEFNGPPRFRDYFELATRLEEKLNRRVDLVRKESLDPLVWASACKELRDVA